MTTLVTGATGFIGSHLVELLLRKGHTVRVLLRRTSDPVWLKDQPVEMVFGDLFDDRVLRQAVEGVEYVYHSAGVTKAKDAEGYYRGNTLGTENLLAAVAQAAPGLKRFVHISSQAAAGPSPGAIPVTEDDSPRPITTYGRSKWESERACHRKMDVLPVTIVRPPVVYGPRDKDVFAFFQTMGMGLQPMIGFNEKLVSMIHVRDLIRGFVMAAENGASAGRTYFITSRRPYSWLEIGDVTRAAMGRQAFRLRIPEPVVYGVGAVAQALAMFSPKPALLNLEKVKDIVQSYWTCDGSRAKRELGFEEETDLSAGIRETVAWYRERGLLK
jgi:nucleoside-diphosphate-sugar epimerase